MPPIFRYGGKKIPVKFMTSSGNMYNSRKTNFRLNFQQRNSETLVVKSLSSSVLLTNKTHFINLHSNSTLHHNLCHPEEITFLKHSLVTTIFSFSYNVFYPIWHLFQMYLESCLQFVSIWTSLKILSSGNGLK